MPSKQLLNPAGAFGYSNLDTGVEVYEYVAGVSITKGQIVSLNTNVQLIPTTVAAQVSAIGMAADTVIAGQICRVVVNGLVGDVTASSALAAGTLTSVSQVTGEVGPASASIGGNIGLVIQNATGGQLAVIFIDKN